MGLENLTKVLATGLITITTLFNANAAVHNNDTTKTTYEDKNSGQIKDDVNWKKTYPNTSTHYWDLRDSLKKSLQEAYAKKYDLSKIYPARSEEDQVQANLRLGTRSLVTAVHGDVNFFGFNDVISDSLLILEEVKKVFGNHPFHYVLLGRQKEIVRFANKNKITILQEFKGLLNSEILPWENPNVNYRTIDDLVNAPKDRNADQYIPPEYKNQDRGNNSNK